MSLTQKTNIAEEAKANLINQFQGKVLIEAWIESYAAEVQELEDAAFQVLDMTNINTANDAQLDVIGAIVGERRQSRPDTTYRRAVKVKILLNKSSGLAEQIREIIGLATDGKTVEIKEMYPAGFEAHIVEDIDPLLIDPVQLGLTVQKARGAGIESQTVVMVAGRFKLDTVGAGLDGGKLGGTF